MDGLCLSQKELKTLCRCPAQIFHIWQPLVKVGLAMRVFANLGCGFVSTSGFKRVSGIAIQR